MHDVHLGTRNVLTEPGGFQGYFLGSDFDDCPPAQLDPKPAFPGTVIVSSTPGVQPVAFHSTFDVAAAQQQEPRQVGRQL